MSRDVHSSLRRGAGELLVVESAVWCREDGPQLRSTANGDAAISKPGRLAGAAEVVLRAEDASGPSAARYVPLSCGVEQLVVSIRNFSGKPFAKSTF